MKLAQSARGITLLFAVVGTPGAAQPAPVAEILLLETGDYGDPGMIRRSVAREGFRSWPTATDYPGNALRERRTAEVFIDVAVGADDRITGCTVRHMQRTGGADFGVKACSIVRERGKFTHALDAAGVPRPGVVPMTMTFNLRQPGQASYSPPPPPPPPPPPGAAPASRPPALTKVGGLALRFPGAVPNARPSTWLDIDKSGRVASCRIRRSTGVDAADAAVCRHLRATRFTPGRDAAGQKVPVASHFVALDVTP